jgi:phosphatidylinositol glycan class T
VVRSVHSAAHLVPMPIPDLSMPFNVICFTSTVLAVYFGGMLNALLRWAAWRSVLRL